MFAIVCDRTMMSMAVRIPADKDDNLRNSSLWHAWTAETAIVSCFVA
jgi:hypothetical protein